MVPRIPEKQSCPGEPLEGLCWLCEDAIEERMIPRSREYRVCIGTGYTGRKCGRFLGMSKLDGYVGCIEGL